MRRFLLGAMVRRAAPTACADAGNVVTLRAADAQPRVVAPSSELLIRYPRAERRLLLLATLIEFGIPLGVVEAEIFFARLTLDRSALELGANHLALSHIEAIVCTRVDSGSLAFLRGVGIEVLGAALLAVALLEAFCLFSRARRAAIGYCAIGHCIGLGGSLIAIDSRRCGARFCPSLRVPEYQQSTHCTNQSCHCHELVGHSLSNPRSLEARHVDRGASEYITLPPLDSEISVTTP